MNGPETRTYDVQGMTCGHCRVAVHEEVSELEGVARVGVDLESGRLEVSGATLDDTEVARAVAEAGYVLVGGESR